MIRTPPFDLREFRNKPLPTEREVMAHWDGNFETAAVSVICITYNQRRYIEDAFRGFLIQQTTFPFEVIVHDDASTDGTADVIRDYAARYPAIFKPVIQTENRYSKGEKPTLLAFGHAQGKYIALCEGDDFWVDERKLEIQYRELVKRPEINVAFHASYQGSPDTGRTRFGRSSLERLSHPRVSTIVSSRAVIFGDGGFMPTASLMFKASLLERLPEWFSDAPVGDYYIQALGAYPNGALYLNKPLCFYRIFSEGSWNLALKSPERHLIFTRKMLHAMEKLDESTGGRFAGIFALLKSSQVLLYFSEREKKKFYWSDKDNRQALKIPSWYRFVPSILNRYAFKVFNACRYLGIGLSHSGSAPLTLERKRREKSPTGR